MLLTAVQVIHFVTAFFKKKIIDYWPSSFRQDGWILPNFLLFIFMDWDKGKVKRKKSWTNKLGQLKILV